MINKNSEGRRWSRHRVAVAVACTLSALALIACSTPYQKKGLRGGFSETRLDENTFRVSFKGNAFTDREKVENFMHYRCAEVTLEAGFDLFVVLGASGEARQGTHTTPTQIDAHTTGSATHLGGGRVVGQSTTQMTVRPGQSYTWTKHGANALIKVFNGKKPQDAPGVYDAREVIRYMSPSVR